MESSILNFGTWCLRLREAAINLKKGGGGNGGGGGGDLTDLRHSLLG